MKKISMMMILILNLFFTSNIFKTMKASTEDEIVKPLIVLQGQDYKQYLNYEGYSIVYNNINFNKCGVYKVQYENNSNKNVIEKKIYVKSYEELSMEKNFNEKHDKLLEKNTLASVQKVKKVDNSYYISLLEKSEGDLYNVKIIKITDGNIVYDKTIFPNVKGRIVDFIVNNNEVTLLVEQERVGYRLEVYLVMLDQFGHIKNMKRYIGDGVDIAKKLLEDDVNYYVIVETTSSNNNDYQFNNDKQSIVIFSYNKKQKKNTEMVYISNVSDIKVVDAIISKGQICLLTKTYDSSVKLKIFDLYVFDCDTLNQIDKFNFSATLTETPLKMDKDIDDNIYIVSTDYENNSYINKIYKLSSNFQKNLLNSYQYIRNATANLVDFLVVNNNEMIMIYNLINSEAENNYGYLYQIIKENEIVAEIESFNSDMYINSLVSSNELLFINNNSIYINTINNVIFKEFKQEVQITKNSDLIFPTLFVNGQKINIDSNKSLINYDINVFGSYLSYYYFTASNVDVIVYGNIVVLPSINVCQNEIYDNNFSLIFNGKAFLNNYRITSGYKIVNPGAYSLVVEGKGQSIIQVDFIVRKISIQETYMNEEPIQITTTSNPVMSENYIDLNNYVKENDFYKKQKNNSIWTLLIPACAFILFIITIIKKKRIR